MASLPRSLLAPGPFTVEQVHDGDRYELSDGHAFYCAPAGPVHGSKHSLGVELLDTDPDVDVALTDGGFSPNPGTMRAPDVSVTSALTQTRGWLPGAPPLALEYAAEGQDEGELQVKVRDLLAAGTRYLWVVRLLGLPRVEVYEPGKPVRVVGLEDSLNAPGVLRNPVRVRALFDRSAAHEAVLRNLLQREGYESLEAVRGEARKAGQKAGRKAGQKTGRQQGEELGLRRAVLEVCELLGVIPTTEQRQQLDGFRKREIEELLGQMKTQRRWPDEESE